MTLPTLIAQQRADALAKAALARKVRASVKDDLKGGKVTFAHVLERGESDVVIGKLRVDELLTSMPGIGKVKAQHIMAQVGVSGTRRVRGLGVHQGDGLLAILG